MDPSAHTLHWTENLSWSSESLGPEMDAVLSKHFVRPRQTNTMLLGCSSHHAKHNSKALASGCGVIERIHENPIFVGIRNQPNCSTAQGVMRNLLQDNEPVTEWHCSWNWSIIPQREMFMCFFCICHRCNDRLMVVPLAMYDFTFSFNSDRRVWNWSVVRSFRYWLAMLTLFIACVISLRWAAECKQHCDAFLASSETMSAFLPCTGCGPNKKFTNSCVAKEMMPSCPCAVCCHAAWPQCCLSSLPQLGHFLETLPVWFRVTISRSRTGSFAHCSAGPVKWLPQAESN